MKELFLKALTLILLSSLLLWPQAPAHAGFLGTGKPAPGAPPGTWVVGDSPATTAGSPILFVHGLNSSALTWFEPNDMFVHTYEQGFPSAYINLHPDKSNWQNGELLAEKIRDIYHHFGEKVTVVAHSKGGVDTQTALLHYGAEPYVKEVITLGSPHHGSELANLAYSNWAGWLAEIIGQRSEGTDSLQTGNMAYFRAQTDALISTQSVPFSTISGTSWGSFGSALYFGGLYLQFFGTNDGAVTVNSSRLSYAQELASNRWDHMQVAQGHLVFPLLQAQMGAQAKKEEKTKSMSAAIVRGGQFNGNGSQAFVVEPNVKKAQISVLANEKLDSAKLHSPDGQVYSVAAVAAEQEHSVFYGAYAHHFEMDHPSAGEWELKMEHPQTTAYLAVIALEGGVSPAIAFDSVRLQSDIDPNAIDVSKTRYTVHVNDDNIAANTASLHALPPQKDASQTITIDIEGMTRNGDRFERTIITNRYVDKHGIIYE
ncbi:esterase/lipase family protein [Shouchella clausii]|uniref:esterase/lipase family protein n=1 Tax=Shouchella clausii TaxID=79880 RepID=UPI000BA7CD68|nr:lipase [Shouchella clausii]PAE97361.1 lipase [Shouchella clausii]